MLVPCSRHLLPTITRHVRYIRNFKANKRQEIYILCVTSFLQYFTIVPQNELSRTFLLICPKKTRFAITYLSAKQHRIQKKDDTTTVHSVANDCGCVQSRFFHVLQKSEQICHDRLVYCLLKVLSIISRNSFGTTVFIFRCRFKPSLLLLSQKMAIT